MSKVHRREALAGITVLALSVPFASAFASPARAASPLHALQGQSFTFTRRLRRELSDGNAISVTRVWDMRFVRAVSDTQIIGEQTGVTVEAPDSLSALSKMEQNRVDTSLFPLILSANGLIIGKAGPSRYADISAAIQHAAARLSASTTDEGIKETGRQFLHQLSQHAHQAASRVPADLFFPRQNRHAEIVPVGLPGGIDGSVRIEFTADTHTFSGLLRSAERRITTHIGENARSSVETWSLEQS